MAKKWFYISLVVFIIMVVVLIVTTNILKRETESAEDEKLTYEQNKNTIKSLNKEHSEKRAYIAEVENNPNEVAKQAKSDVDKFVEILKDNENKTDDEKQNVYKSELKNIATKDIINNDDLTNLNIPDDYETYISTSRGESIQVLVKDKAKQPNRYISVNYNPSTNKVENIIEYKVRN
ncbi:hypothetical protein [Staphylococcus gallinarum]|uniref:hypothetical protein n=1 Tax=Staphylococcus gallinarum TaxID=1293 RepID=UPI001E336262|nr:hypothetical protein [Staphylococcus gallinarum]MCD8845165.1 hypothetical protein [Staphylococcus gallinarum]